jgi:hypothetical protein
VRGVVRVVPVAAPTVRAKASVPEAIDPTHRDAPPYPAPRPRDAVRESKKEARKRAAAREAEAREAAEREAEARRAAGPKARNGVTPAEPPSIRSPSPDRPEPEWPPPDRPVVTVTAAEPHRSSVPEQSGARPAPNPDVRPPRRRLRLLAPLAAGLLAAAVAATTYLVADRRAGGDDDLGRWRGTAAEAAPFAVPAGPTADPFGTTAPTLAGVPTRLKVKAIGVDTALETLRLGDDGELTPPEDFGRAGWYADGTRPGDVGPAVIAGHVDSKRGPAVFYRLRELEAGDRIDVVRGGRTVRFTVTSTAWYPKKRFPTDRVYGPTPDRQLRLITCGGVFDRSLRSYRDNLVVYAVAA